MNKNKLTYATLLALRALSVKGMCGAELIKKVGLRAGTIYPVLMRLKEDGWLSSRDEPSANLSRPPRRYFYLTPKGAKELEELLKSLQ